MLTLAYMILWKPILLRQVGGSDETGGTNPGKAHIKGNYRWGV